MKILLFGKNGQVGWELNRSLLPLGEIEALGSKEADFSDPESLRRIVCDVKPNIIINAAAYTAVDKAESEVDLAEKVNAISPGVLAEEASKIDALFVHYSTDYVFDGTKDGVYTEQDKPCPVNTYGRTKLEGELAVQSSGCDYLIFRTSWVYASRGSNFLLTILRLAKERETLGVVSDQIGAPTSSRLIAETTLLCLQSSINRKISGTFTSGLYHLTSSGYGSWYDFAKKIIEIDQVLGGQHKLKDLKAIPTKEYPTPATRPLNSKLALEKLEKEYDVKMPAWEEALVLCLESLR